MVSLAPEPGGGNTHRSCANLLDAGCNWLVARNDPNPFCIACRLNQVIPRLAEGANRHRWVELEGAKRRLVYGLLSLGLPVHGKEEMPDTGLAFAFLADTSGPFEEQARVITGHAAGLITINVAETDPLYREEVRVQMGEPYRTLLGHFRHESGHYYWERLIHRSSRRDPFTALFGDCRRDYPEALRSYYENGPGRDWRNGYISAYASAHPWEDWAETWAHYLHMRDTVETAIAFGLVPESPHANGDEPFDSLLSRWIDLSLAMNGLSRSLGLPDSCPFPISEPAAAKLRFVHETISSFPNRTGASRRTVS